jgi:hypothetical protein
MSATDICGRLRDWCDLYPNPLALTEENVAARADEDERLGRFAGLDALDREQVIELISWKFQSMAHRKALALRGVSLERWGGQDGAAVLIRRALAESADDKALATVCGIYRFGPAMSTMGGRQRFGGGGLISRDSSVRRPCLTVGLSCRAASARIRRR